MNEIKAIRFQTYSNTIVYFLTTHLVTALNLEYNQK